MDNLLARAYRAYFMVEGDRADQPSEVLSGQEEIGDKSYIVLRNANGILAIYRVTKDNMLKRMFAAREVLRETYEQVMAETEASAGCSGS